MPPRIKVDPGERYGRVTIIREVEPRNKMRHFLCLCSCGALWKVPLIQLRTGQTKSCGCLRKERFIRRITHHGQSRTSLHAIWRSMKQRCLNPKNPVYGYYGGRGITVCDEWLNFEPFQEWALKNGYAKGLTIERKDVNGNYEPSNCKWIPQSEQSSNTRRARMLTYKGQIMSVKDWAKKLRMNYDTLYGRIYKGWSVEQALTYPVGIKGDGRARKNGY